MSKRIDNFTRGYLVAALWTSTDAFEFPLDSKYSIDDIDQSAVDKAVKDCEEFQSENESKLSLYYERNGGRSWIEPDCSIEDYAGHDFWLTRNGHGCGFWDRSLGKLGDELAEACAKFGEAELYVGDDGKLYFS